MLFQFKICIPLMIICLNNVAGQIQQYTSTYSIDSLSSLKSKNIDSVLIYKCLYSDYDEKYNSKGLGKSKLLIGIYYTHSEKKQTKFAYNILSGTELNTMKNSKETRTYDDKGELLKIEIENLDSKIKNISYYSNSKLHTIEAYNQEGKLKESIVYEEKDGLSAKLFKTAKGVAGYIQLRKLDQQGNEIYFAECFGKDTSDFKIKFQYKYNLNDQIIQQINFDSKERITEISDFIYDKNGRIVESISHNPSGIETARSKYDYNSQGEIVYWYSQRRDWDEYSHKYEYNYDKYDNWVKLIIWKNERPIHVIERKIFYHK